MRLTYPKAMSAVYPNLPRGNPDRFNFVIVAQIAIQDDARLKIEARMWSVPDRKQVVAQTMVYQIENWRRAAELLANEISRPLTGGAEEPR